ncbi:MAG: hypothetical protein K9G76_11180 [Bacteroidales bacterium]|nr:hypothetical protein [Bacteroidales bacterium]MCF8404956.1 hypothetical protein [Bacteroidales bacterium]
MDRSEKIRDKEHKKRLKKQRKEYVRKEKESIKRQKTELHRKQKRRSSRFGIRRKIKSFLELFKTSKKSDKSARRRYGPSWRRRIEFFLDQRRNRKKVKREMARKRKESKKLRVKYLIQEKKSIKGERRYKQEKLAPMRRRIRSERYNYYKTRFIKFIRQPIKIKKRSREEQILRKHIKQDIRDQRRKTLLGIPSLIAGGIREAYRRRKNRLDYSTREFKKSMAVFGGVWNKQDYRIDLTKTFINSTVLYLLGFSLMYYFSQLVTIFTASFFDIPAELFSYRIFWPLYTYSTLYSRQALILIFGSGPIAALILSVLIYRIFLLVRVYVKNVNVLLIWIMFHGLNMFFGAYIAGVVTRTGFVYTTEWIFLSNIFDTEEILFVITSVVVLLLAGVYSTRLHLMAVTSRNLIEPRVRLYFVLFQVFFPALIGGLFLFAINFPKNPPELIILYAVSFLMIFPVFANYNSPSNILIGKHLKANKVKLGWIYLLLTVIIFAVIRLIIYKGISFS